MKTKAQNYTVNNVFRTTQILNTNYTITNMIICNCNLIIIDMHVHANFILTNQFLMLVYLIVLEFFVNHVIQCNRLRFVLGKKGPGGSMSQVVGLPNNSYKPITNTAWVRARLCKLQKGCTRLAAGSDKVYQLLTHGRWFSPGTPASPTTKTGRHDIAEILLKVVLNKIKNPNSCIR